jgi:hypothetical protein
MSLSISVISVPVYYVIRMTQTKVKKKMQKTVCAALKEGGWLRAGGSFPAASRVPGYQL